MFQRLYELSQCLPKRADWERLNEGMPANYDRGLALCLALAVNGAASKLTWVIAPSFTAPAAQWHRFYSVLQAGNTASRLASVVKALVDYPELFGEKQWLADSGWFHVVRGCSLG